MKFVALTLAAAALVSASPILASPPPTRPSVQYYILDGHTRIAGPFSSYHACYARREMLRESRGNAVFCMSNWIGR